MGAIATGDLMILNENLLPSLEVAPHIFAQILAMEKEELLRRNRVYRKNRPFPQIRERTIILVDDGMASGSTIRAALTVLKKQQPQSIIIAVPVAPPSICQQLKAEVDNIVCLLQPENLYSISTWYEKFPQTTDAEVLELLQIASSFPIGLSKMGLSPENSQNACKSAKVLKNRHRVGLPDPLFARLKLLSNEQKRPMNQILAEALSAYLNKQS